MASVTLNFSASQTARVQEAVAIYNDRHGLTGPAALTPKQWLYVMIRGAVLGHLAGQADAAAQVVRNAIKADLTGEA